MEGFKSSQNHQATQNGNQNAGYAVNRNQHSKAELFPEDIYQGRKGVPPQTAPQKDARQYEQLYFERRRITKHRSSRKYCHKDHDGHRIRNSKKKKRGKITQQAFLGYPLPHADLFERIPEIYNQPDDD